MELVLAGLLGFVTFEEYDSATLVTSREVVAGLVELDGGYYVCLGDIFYITFVTEAPKTLRQPIVYQAFASSKVCAAQHGGGRTE